MDRYSINTITPEPDALGFSPPLFLSSTDKGILSLYKSQALSVLWRAPLPKEITDYVQGVLFTSARERIEALDSVQYIVNSDYKKPTCNLVKEEDIWRLTPFKTTLRE